MSDTSEFKAVIAPLLARYRSDPVGWARAIHGMEPDHNQQAVMQAIADGKRQISVRSGHGVGKTRMLSLVVSWFCNTRWPWKVVMTAPTATQLWDSLWPEVRSRFRELPGGLSEMFEVGAERISLKADPDNCFVSPRTSQKDRPEAIQGIHSENVLLLLDEASAIPDEIFIAGYGSMSGEHAHTILTGNPTRRTGFFANTHLDPEFRAGWNTFHINGEHSKWVSRQFIDDIIRMFGRDSNEYRVRVLGEFPDSDSDVLIKRALVEAACHREIVCPAQRPVWGIDPARFGRDSTAFSERFGNYFKRPIRWPKEDTMQLTGRILNEVVQRPSPMRPALILVDVIGVGSGVVDRCREIPELQPLVRGVNVTEAAPPGSRGYRLRDHLWLAMYDWLLTGKGHIDHDEEMIQDLTTPTYQFNSEAQYRIESKDAMRKRSQRSPDLADSMCLTFAGPASIIATGRMNSVPVKSRVRVV
jgi:phage terminase large subunit